MIRQFAFDLTREETYLAEDYFPAGSNARAHGQVMAGAWPGGRLLLLGPGGAGKSHLAHIWARAAGALVLNARDLRAGDLPAAPGPLVVEDAEGVAGLPAAEEALFHLWNRPEPLLITASCPPRDWALALPDLVSRVQSMAVAQLDPPDDALLTAVLVKLFADRQVHVNPTLIAYLLARMERSVAAARDIVARLDAGALALGKPITRQLAAELLQPDTDLDRSGDE